MVLPAATASFGSCCVAEHLSQRKLLGFARTCTQPHAERHTEAYQLDKTLSRQKRPTSYSPVWVMSEPP